MYKKSENYIKNDYGRYRVIDRIKVYFETMFRQNVGVVISR